jgi:thiol-disulfide isomerase/thioredoxin
MTTTPSLARFLAPVASALALTALTMPLAAQEDPYELIRKSDQNLQDAGAIRYTAVRSGVGFVAAQTPNRTGTVTVSMKDGELRLRAQGKEHRTDGSTPEFLSVYDGSTVTSIRHADKQVITGALDSSFGPLGGAGAGLASPYLLWEGSIGGQFRNDEKPYPLTYEGTALVGEDLCHVIGMGFDEFWGVDEYESWIFLDTNDLLPRRIDLGYYDDNGEMGIVTVSMSQVEILSTVDDSVFELEAPEGYEVVEQQAAEADGGQQRARAIAVGEPAPEWTLKDPNGNDFSLVDYRGRVVVMDFWATWCGPCRLAMPGLQELHEEFSGQPVSILGINCWESGDPVAFMQREKLNYGLLLGADQVAMDYGVEGIPTFYVIGKDGKVVYHEVGFDPAGTDKLRTVIRHALEAE